MKSYPSLSYPTDKSTDGVFADGTVVIQEKLDGSNFRFTYNQQDGFTFGSRRTEGDGLHRDQFSDTIEFVKENADRGELESTRHVFGEVVFFGEAMNPHTISYDWEGTPDFLGFDIWVVDEERFLPVEEVEYVFNRIGLPVAPIVDFIPAEEWDDYDFECPESKFYDGKAEGVVFKNHETDTYAKFVREDFKEKNKKTFGKPKREQTKGAVKLSYQYITEQRIEKAAHRLRDEGEYDSLKMEMMKDLPEEVIRDMADEEAGNIFMSENWEVDIHDFRSNVSSRCAEVLRRMIDRKIKEEL